MTNTAEEIKHSPVDVEGLDDVFEVEEHTARQSDNRVLTDCQQADAGMTLKEAAKHFRLGTSTIRAKLKTGELYGVKVPGRHGHEWRIFTEGSQHPAKTSSTEQARNVDTAQQADAFRTIHELNQRLDAANEKLQAAAYRNGYLESQLEASRETIRLLEDRSLVPWYRRFWGWFTGSSVT